MKKIMLIIALSFGILSTTSAADVDLNTCSLYYDGCNNCSVIDGKIWACTERYCIHQDEPKCLEKKSSDESKQETFCKQYGGIFESQWNTCGFENKQIWADTLYNSYLDFSGQMMYMGGSKYFDESTGFYDYSLVRSDLNTLWFVRLNIPKLYKKYQENIDMKMDSLQSKLDSQNETRNNFKKVLWEKLLDRIDEAVEGFIDSTAGMSHAKKEIYLIKKVEILSDIREKYSNIENTSTKVLTLIDYFIYKIERYIAYE